MKNKKENCSAAENVSENVQVHCHITINYIAQTLIEAIFTEVKSIVRGDCSMNTLVQRLLSPDQAAEMSFHKFYQSQYGHCSAGIVSRAFHTLDLKKEKRESRNADEK